MTASDTVAAQTASPGSASYSLQDLEAKALRSLTDEYVLLIDPARDTSALALVPQLQRSGELRTVPERIAAVAARRSFNAQFGLVYTRIDVRLHETRAERSADAVVLRAREVTWHTFEVGTRGPRPEDVWAKADRHEFIFRPVAGEWVLMEDRPLWPKYEETERGPRLPLDSPTLTHRAASSQGGPKPIAVRPVSAWGTYNATAAVNYARQWWGNGLNYSNWWNYNSSYKYFPQDCTNFMSQALRAGGWTMKWGAENDVNTWWYDDYNHLNSNTWSASDWLIQFTYRSGRGYALGAFTDLRLGDIMWADWANPSLQGYPEHSMMLTTRLSSNYADIRFTYHTHDRLDKPLTEILNENPGGQYWGSRIQYTSN